MNQVGFVFRSAPHSSSRGREGLDALLATAALNDSIQVCFLGAGVLQLLANQDTQAIGTKNHAPMFGLFELYDLDNIYVCEASLSRYGIGVDDLMIEVQVVSPQALAEVLNTCQSLLTF